MFPKIVGFPPKSSILIGFSIIFTIHFEAPLFLETPIYRNGWMQNPKKNICCMYNGFLFISSLQNPIISHLSQKAFLIRKILGENEFLQVGDIQGKSS